MTEVDPADGQPSGTDRRKRRWVAACAVAIGLGVVAGLAAVYVTGGFADNTAQAACPAASRVAGAVAPLIGGGIAGLQTLDTPVGLASLSFRTADGASVRIGDFAGQTVLFNLWATWCGPCRLEMPWLDQLQADLGGRDDFEVVAVSVDQRDEGRVETMLQELGVSALTTYKEPTMALFSTLRDAGLAQGMPTTLLIDRTGCAVAALAGAGEWNAPEAKAMLRAAIDASAG